MEKAKQANGSNIMNSLAIFHCVRLLGMRISVSKCLYLCLCVDVFERLVVKIDSELEDILCTTTDILLVFQHVNYDVKVGDWVGKQQQRAETFFFLYFTIR